MIENLKSKLNKTFREIGEQERDGRWIREEEDQHILFLLENVKQEMTR